MLVPTSFNIPSNQTNSETIEARLLYSASAELLDTVVCFFALHKTNESPILIKKHVTDFLIRVHAALVASQYAFAGQRNSLAWLFLHISYTSESSLHVWFLGACRNWPSGCTPKQMSDLVIASLYLIIFPISLWYDSWLDKGSSVVCAWNLVWSSYTFEMSLTLTLIGTLLALRLITLLLKLAQVHNFSDAW